MWIWNNLSYRFINFYFFNDKNNKQDKKKSISQQTSVKLILFSVLFMLLLCMYNRMWRNPDCGCLDGSYVTAALKQAKPSRAEQSHRPGPDGPLQGLNTRTEPGLKTRTKPWIRDRDSTRNLPGRNPDHSPSPGTFNPEWSRLRDG